MFSVVFLKFDRESIEGSSLRQRYDTVHGRGGKNGIFAPPVRFSLFIMDGDRGVDGRGLSNTFGGDLQKTSCSCCCSGVRSIVVVVTCFRIVPSGFIPKRLSPTIRVFDGASLRNCNGWSVSSIGDDMFLTLGVTSGASNGLVLGSHGRETFV